MPDLHYYPEVDSTNDIALSLAAAGAPAGTAVVADVQRAGRGRRGREWFSPPGAGVGVANALVTYTALPIELKWPNDVVIGRPWRKLAGVLCESTGVGARVDAVIAGVGVNLRTASYPPEIGDRATSIEAELGRTVDRDELASACVAQVVERTEELGTAGAETVLTAWRRLARAGLRGAKVSWQDPAGDRLGSAHDVDEDGALLVESSRGVERLVSGEVRWERLSND